MISTNINQMLNIILPNTNRALKEVLDSSSPKELQNLSQGKDLKSLFNAMLTQSSMDSSQDKLLLELLKTNPTLKDLGSTTNNLRELLSILKQDKSPLPLERLIESFFTHIKDVSEKTLQTKIQNSGLFLENKLSNSQISKEELKALLSSDLKAVLLKTQEELKNSTHPNRQELIKHIDRVVLQIDYHQLTSHLSNATSLYIPYSWDALENGNVTIKNLKDGKFFTDIELELKEYGHLKLRLGMFENRQLNINITTESSELKTLLQENIAGLKRQLVDVGITPREIHFLDDTIDANSYSQAIDEIALGFEVKV